MDVILAVQEFFPSIPQPLVMASSLITLISKVSAPHTFSYFRPICLTSFLSKICTRIIATRLSTSLPKLISPDQTGFLKGYDIFTQALLASEMIHMLDKGESQLCLKLNMMKAFDRVSWEYLELLLVKFGFLAFYVRIVINYLSSTRLSVLINGVPSGVFQPNRGVKQGDLLSPLLFILSSEGFSKGLKAPVVTDRLQPIRLGRMPFHITHLAYADDLLVFLRGTVRTLRGFQSFLTSYETASGQKVNYNKSSFIPSSIHHCSTGGDLGTFFVCDQHVCHFVILVLSCTKVSAAHVIVHLFWSILIHG